jgi:hypothetical protein
MDAIKTVTNCPTCGAECIVEGKTTHYYVPRPSIARYRERLDAYLARLHADLGPDGGADIVEGISKFIDSGELERG